MTPRFTLILSIVTLSAFSGAVRAETLEGAEKRLAAASKRVTSVKANRQTVTRIDMAGAKSISEGKGTLEMMNKDGKWLWRVESRDSTTVDAAGQKIKTETTGLMVCDGKIAWSLMETMGQKTVTKMKVPDENSSLAGAVFFETLRKDHRLKLLPDETIEGKSAFVFESTPIKASESEGKTVLYILKDTAITAKSILFDASGKPINTMTLSEIKINASIPADRFTFTPPAGAQVMDMTKQ